MTGYICPTVIAYYSAVIAREGGRSSNRRCRFGPRPQLLGLYRRERNRWHPIHRRHERLDPSRSRTQNQSRRRLHQKTRSRPPGLFRGLRRYRKRYPTGEAFEEMESSVEDSFDRRNQSELDRSLSFNCETVSTGSPAFAGDDGWWELLNPDSLPHLEPPALKSASRRTQDPAPS